MLKFILICFTSLSLAACSTDFRQLFTQQQVENQTVPPLEYELALNQAKQKAFPFTAQLEMPGVASASGEIWAYRNDYALDQQTFIEVSNIGSKELKTLGQAAVWLGTAEQPQQQPLGQLQPSNFGWKLQYQSDQDLSALTIITLYSAASQLLDQSEFILNPYAEKNSKQ